MDTWLFPIHNWIDFSNSILPVLLLLVVLMAVGRIRPGKPTIVSFVFGMLFSMAMVFGARLDQDGSVLFGNVSMWLVIVAFGIVMTCLVSGLWQAMERFGSTASRRQRMPVQSTHVFWRTAIVVFLLYFVVFLAVYPGFFVYDAQEEYLEVVTRQFTTHHPLCHVLLLGGMIQLFYKLSGSVNIGIAAYILIQMAMLCVISGYFVWKLQRRGLGRLGQWLLTLYLGLCPPLVMFALCSAKDGLFTGMLLVQVLLLQELCREPEQFLCQKKKLLCLSISTVGMMLLRNNGCYAFAVFLIVLVIFLHQTGKAQASQLSEHKTDPLQKRSLQDKCFSWKRRTPAIRILGWGLLLIVVYLGMNRGLAAVTQAEDSEHQEILTVPIMQLARTYAYEPDSFTAQQKEQLYRYLPEEALLRYTPKVSDAVKVSFSNASYEQDAAGFWKLWAKIGLEHPFSYLNAWLMTSYGFWYPDTVIDVYRGNTVFTYTYEDSSYFGYEVEEPGVRQSKLPFLDELYRKMSLEVFQQKVPVLSMLFSPGFLFWCMMFGVGFLLNRKEKKRSLAAAVPFGLPVLIFLTFLLGPTFLVRYVVFWWVLVPLLAVEIYAILTDDYVVD